MTVTVPHSRALVRSNCWTVPVKSCTEMACRGGPSSCVLGTVIWWYSQTGAPSNVDLSFSVVVVVIVVVSVEVDVLLALRCTETADLLLLLRPDKDGEKPITPDGKNETQQSDPTTSR